MKLERQLFGTKMCCPRTSFLSQRHSNCDALILLVLVIVAAQTVFCQTTCNTGPCFPPPLDISGRFNVTANSTCGEEGSPETYCLNLECDKVCDANDDALKHPASFVQDPITPKTFWKSKNFDYPVVLELDIGSKMLLYRSTVTFFHQLPAAMYFLKSNDSGATYSPLVFFATNCTEYFNMPKTPESEIDALETQCFEINVVDNTYKQVSFIYIFFYSILESVYLLLVWIILKISHLLFSWNQLCRGYCVCNRQVFCGH